MTASDWWWTALLTAGLLTLTGLWTRAWLDHRKECPRCQHRCD